MEFVRLEYHNNKLTSAELKTIKKLLRNTYQKVINT